MATTYGRSRPSGRSVKPPQGRADPGDIIERMQRKLEIGRDLTLEGEEAPGSRGSGPRNRAHRMRRREVPNFKFKPWRLLGAGAALSIANPFGWNPINQFFPYQPAQYYGRDEGLICYVSPCTPVSGPHYFKSSNNCTPLTPQCPFGSLVLLPSTCPATSYLASVACRGGTPAQYPFANIIYEKTGGIGGYFVHEVQEMLPDTDTGVLPANPFRIIPLTQTALGFAEVNPNFLTSQKPDGLEELDAAHKSQADPRLQPAVDTLSGRQTRVTQFTRNKVRRIRSTTRLNPVRKPPPKTKETKVQFSSFAVYRGVMKAIDAYTETQDFVRALHGGLPCELVGGKWKTGPKGGRYFEKGSANRHRFDTGNQLKDLNKHWEKMNWNKAFLNVAANQYEDAVIGMTNRFMADSLNARRSWNDYAKFKGLQRDFRQLTEDAAAARRNLRKGERGACK